MNARGIASVAQLAEKSRINRSHIYALWRASNTVRLDSLRRLAMALRVPVSVLIGDEPAELRETPYDTDEEIRRLVDGLAALPRSVRRELIRQMMWHVDRERGVRLGEPPPDTTPAGHIQPNTATPTPTAPASSAIDTKRRLPPGLGMTYLPGDDEDSADEPTRSTADDARGRRGRR